MRFQRRFRVAASVEDVAAFHRKATALEAISPPFPPVKVLEAPDPLETGDRMVLKIWVGPVPVRWVAEIEELPQSLITARGFADRQVEGPFAAWRHEHRFEPDASSPGASWVVDDIEATLSRRPHLYLLGRTIWAGLPALFAYRRRRTRKLLGR